MLKRLLRKIVHSKVVSSFFDRSLFKPRPIDIFYNPLYLLRRGLLLAISATARRFHGCVLDVGCGSKPYRHLFDVSHYVGIDVQTSGHPSNEKTADLFYDGYRLPFANDTFDGGFCSEVLEHVPSPWSLLAEIHRVLKPGALLLLTIPFAWMEHEQPFDFRRYTSFGIVNLVGSTGFEIEQITKVGSYVEAVAQLFTHHRVFQNRFSRAFLIAPIHLSALMAKRLVPRDDRLFINLVVIVRKVAAPDIATRKL